MGNQNTGRSVSYPFSRSICLLLLSLLLGLAHASFNAAPCHTFECHFQTVGIFLGLIGGLPISGVIFIGVHMGFAHPQRSKVRQMFLGGLVGLIAFEIAAVVGAAYAMEHQAVRHCRDFWVRMHCSPCSRFYTYAQFLVLPATNPDNHSALIQFNR